MRTHKKTIPKSGSGNRESRSGIERRRFSYAAHIPERRSGMDRRNAELTPNITEGRSGAIPLAAA